MLADCGAQRLNQCVVTDVDIVQRADDQDRLLLGRGWHGSGYRSPGGGGSVRREAPAETPIRAKLDVLRDLRRYEVVGVRRHLDLALGECLLGCLPACEINRVTRALVAIIDGHGDCRVEQNRSPYPLGRRDRQRQREQAAERVAHHVDWLGDLLRSQRLQQIGDVCVNVPRRIPAGLSVPAQIDGQHVSVGERSLGKAFEASAMTRYTVDREQWFAIGGAEVMNVEAHDGSVATGTRHVALVAALSHRYPARVAERHLGVGGRLAAGPADELVRAGYAGEAAAGPALADGMSRSDLAHAIVLIESGGLDAARGADLLRGLLELDAIPPAEFLWDPAVGDAFQNREAELTRRVGPAAAGWLSAGRARREAFRVALRLVAREGSQAVAGRLAEATAALAAQARPLAGVLAADYTYLQPAQPTTVGHLVLAWVYPVLRSAERLQAVYATLDGSVAGVGGSAGSRWPLDRARLAALLGHDTVEVHAKDAMWQADQYVELLSTLAIAATALSQFAQDLEIWCSQEFGWCELDDAHSRASALMPQKKNPYALAVLRTAAGQATGDLTAALTTLHTGSARTDHFHLLNGLIPRALGDAERNAALAAGVAAGLRIDTGRMEWSARAAFITAADVADMLAQTTTLDYRSAHHVVGRVVRDLDADGGEIDASRLERAAKQVLDAKISVDPEALAAALDPGACAVSRPQLGGSDPVQVVAMCDDVAARSEAIQQWAKTEHARSQNAAGALRVRAQSMVIG